MHNFVAHVTCVAQVPIAIHAHMSTVSILSQWVNGGSLPTQWVTPDVIVSANPEVTSDATSVQQ